MKIHYLQHVPFEDLGSIEDWAIENAHSLTSTQFYTNFELPDIQDFDLLIVMGGSMGVYEEDKFEWLKKEKAFIKKAIDAKKKVLGICLGSQLIAEVLGAKVYPNNQQEIGWFPIELNENGQKHPFFKDFPAQFTVFHWHGDTFELPKGAVHIAKSPAASQQAFVFENHVLALQFHFEMKESLIKGMLEEGDGGLKKAQYVQTGDEILKIKEHFEPNRMRLWSILTAFTKNY
jgi:GMP synthase-like glutamine amidotransferase